MGSKPYYYILLYTVLFLSLTFSIAAANGRRQKILVLHSYHQGLEWTDDITEGIKEVFKPYEQNFELYYEYLDTKRNAGEAYMERLYHLQKAKLRNNSFSAVIAADNNALTFVVKNGEELFGVTPVIFCGINNFTPKQLGERTNITGVIERTDYAKNLNLIKKLHPERNNIKVILDQTPTGNAAFEELQAILQEFPELTFSFYRDFLLTEVGKEIAQFGTQDVIYLLAFNRDRKGNFISYKEGIEMIKEAANVPIYGCWDFYLGKGLVGGILTRGIDQGRRAGEMALEILHGKPISEVPIDYEGATVPIFDFRELEQFSIASTNLLPENSVIIHTPPTLIEKYSQYMIFIICLLFITSLLLWGRVFLIRRRNHRLLEDKKALDSIVKSRTKELELEKSKLEEAINQVKTLEGFLPICSGCKKIRDDEGYWNQIENYISSRTDAVFSHGLCPDCAKNLYSNFLNENKK